MIASSSLGAAAVALIYIVYSAYSDYLRAQRKRECMLRERVAYLLWQAAGNIGTPGAMGSLD
jgi:hypothetical protein